MKQQKLLLNFIRGDGKKFNTIKPCKGHQIGKRRADHDLSEVQKVHDEPCLRHERGRGRRETPSGVHDMRFQVRDNGKVYRHPLPAVNPFKLTGSGKFLQF